jgi:hypothetical protein
MTRKDYELIAKILREARILGLSYEDIISAFAVNLGKTNPRFDVAKFLAACNA